MLQETTDKIFELFLKFIYSSDNTTDEDLKKEIKIIVADYAAACLLDSTIRSELGV